MMVKKIAVELAALFVLLVASGAAVGQEFTVFGEKSNIYSLDELEETFDQHEIKTITTWTGTDALTFSGPLFSELLKASNVSGMELEVGAENDYSALVSWSMVEKFQPILATRSNGELLNPDDYGPFWLIWPRSEHPSELTQLNDTLWVWFAQSVKVAK